MEIFVKENIKHIRKINKHTQVDASKRIGISRQALSSYEEGRAIPPIDVAIKICETYFFTLDELFLKNLSTYKRNYVEPSKNG